VFVLSNYGSGEDSFNSSNEVNAPDSVPTNLNRTAIAHHLNPIIEQTALQADAPPSIGKEIVSSLDFHVGKFD
jgi:hypothetical protein